MGRMVVHQVEASGRPFKKNSKLVESFLSPIGKTNEGSFRKAEDSVVKFALRPDKHTERTQNTCHRVRCEISPRETFEGKKN